MMNTTLLNQTENKTSTTIEQDFAKLYERYLPLVHRICYRYTKNREEADDLAQEVFVKVHASYGGFQGNAQPSTWLYRVAVNHSLDHLRWKKRQTELLNNYGEDLSRSPQQVDCADKPAIRLLHRLMENMEAVNRQVVFLRFEVGLTHEEIAEVCGISRVAITKRLAKFQAKIILLKEELTDSREAIGCEHIAQKMCLEDTEEV